MSDDSEQRYEVGYRKPPRATQFQKGRSGNSRGRPKGKKTFIMLLNEALEERVWVNDGGQRKSISKRQALAKQFANKGAAGDMKIAKLLLELIQLIDREPSGALGSQRKADEEARERIFARLENIRARLTAGGTLNMTEGSKGI